MANSAAERHLLLGLLALQNGLIDQGKLVAAFQAWTLDKSRSLAEHLVALGHLSAAKRSAIEAIAALHVEAHGGDAAKSLAAIPAGHRPARASPAWATPTSRPPSTTCPPRRPRPAKARRNPTPTPPRATP